MMTSMVQW